jgi:TonB family protein
MPIFTTLLILLLVAADAGCATSALERGSKPDRAMMDVAASGEAKSVLLGVRIGADGSVKHVDVVNSSGLSSVDDYAVRTMYNFKFHPALKKDGSPVECEIKYSIRLQYR